MVFVNILYKNSIWKKTAVLELHAHETGDSFLDKYKFPQLEATAINKV